MVDGEADGVEECMIESEVVMGIPMVKSLCISLDTEGGDTWLELVSSCKAAGVDSEFFEPIKPMTTGWHN